MERERKKTIALAAVIGLSVLVAIFIFLWGAYLDRGKISINAQVPFKVVTAKDEFICDISPCELTMKSGINDIVLSKNGYKDISSAVDVKLWGTTEIRIKFTINPYIETTESFPQADKRVDYKIIFDKRTNSYKLVIANDEQKRPIVYFPNKITPEKIIGSKNGALIIEKGSAYKINVKNKTRDKVNKDFSTVGNGVWSKDGEKMAFTTDDSQFVQILDESNKSYETELGKDVTTYTWNYENNLTYVTMSDDTYIFGIFNPEALSYTEVFLSNELKSIPDVIIETNNGKRIYFKIGEEKFVLILESF